MGQFILLYQHKMTVNVKVIFTYKMYTLKFKVYTSHTTHCALPLFRCEFVCMLTLSMVMLMKNTPLRIPGPPHEKFRKLCSEYVKRFDILLLCMKHNKYILDKKPTKTNTN